MVDDTVTTGRRHYDDVCFRVWPDGTVQGCDDDAYYWMSDDYVLVRAVDEADALEQAHGR